MNLKLNRRKFIKDTTVAGVSLSMMSIPNIVKGLDDRKVRLALIGLGLRGRSHLRLALTGMMLNSPILPGANGC